VAGYCSGKLAVLLNNRIEDRMTVAIISDKRLCFIVQKTFIELY